MDSSALATILRFVLGITLTVAGIGKVQNLPAFVQGVVGYQVLPASLARWYGRQLPIVEIGTGAFLLLGVWVRPAAIISIILFTSFAVAIGINLKRKREMPRFCFGADTSDKMGWHSMARVMFLLLSAIVLALAPSARDPLHNLIRAVSATELVNLIPVFLLVSFCLVMIRLIEESVRIAKYLPILKLLRRRLSK